MSTAAAAWPDLQKPLVPVVGHLGEQYWTWVHKPVPGKPRFFATNCLENITRCPWWLVPVIWIPIYASICYAAVAHHGLQLGQLASLQLRGVILWQLVEYIIHR